jgi:tight adherence protein C
MGPVLWVGASLLLAELAPFRRPSLVARLGPYLGPRPLHGVDRPTLRQRLAPVSLVLGERLARLAGTAEPLDLRLRRIHAVVDPAAFRFRQLSHAALALGAAGAVVAALGGAVPAGLVVPLLLAAPLVTFLVHEQQLAAAVRARRRQVFRELPVVAEQLAMHLGAGLSVPATVCRLADRGHGACAADFGRIARQLQQGVGEHQALREWAELSGEPDVGRLVGVLTLDHEATDLDRLVEQEADAVRTETHRRLLDELEKRGQQVWVPVTVATLLPGSLLLLVPFLDALRLFAGA